MSGQGIEKGLMLVKRTIDSRNNFPFTSWFLCPHTKREKKQNGTSPYNLYCYYDSPLIRVSEWVAGMNKTRTWYAVCCMFSLAMCKLKIYLEQQERRCSLLYASLKGGCTRRVTGKQDIYERGRVGRKRI